MDEIVQGKKSNYPSIFEEFKQNRVFELPSKQGPFPQKYKINSIKIQQNIQIDDHHSEPSGQSEQHIINDEEERIMEEPENDEKPFS